MVYGNDLYDGAGWMTLLTATSRATDTSHEPGHAGCNCETMLND